MTTAGGSSGARTVSSAAIAGRSDVDLIDWLRFVPFATLASALLVIGDPVMRLAFALGWRSYDAAMTAWYAAGLRCLAVGGARIVVESSPDAVPDGPVVIVANHQSLFDIAILGAVLGRVRPRFIAKRALRRWIPVVSFGLRRGQHALVDRDNPLQSIRAILAAGRWMGARRFGVVVFAEGRRARDGRLQPFQSAGVAALLKSAPSAAVVPVAIDGSWRLSMHPLGVIRRGTLVRVVVGAPIDRRRFDTAEAMVREARRVVGSILSGGDAPPGRG